MRSGNVLSSGDYIADGVVRPVQEPNGQTLPESYTREGDTDVRLDSSFSDPQFGQITLLAHFGLDAQGNLHIVNDATMGAYPPQHDDETCIRQ